MESGHNRLDDAVMQDVKLGTSNRTEQVSHLAPFAQTVDFGR